MAKVLEKAEQMFAVSVVPKNAEPKRPVVEKIPVEEHQQYRAAVDFAAPEFRPRSVMEKIPVEEHQQYRAVIDFAAPEFRPRSMNIFSMSYCTHKEGNSMNELQIFENAMFGKIRTVVIDNEPWFIGKDVATALGYKDTSDALKKHVDEEDKLTRRFADSGQIHEMYVINESGVYSLVFSSKLPTAKAFKRWVTSEVLPAIRKHGGYMTPEKVEEALMNPDVMIRLATELKAERQKRQALSKLADEQGAQIAKMQPKAFFADAVSTSETSILIGGLAKLIKQNGVDIGQKRLFQWMRENGFLIKSGADKNIPTQRAMEYGLFEVKERSIVGGDGANHVTRTTKVTGKGQVYFVNKFLQGMQRR